MAEYRLTEAGRIGLRMLLDAEALYRADRNGLHLLGMEDVVDLPDEWVEPVPPPLPPEPEPGVYLVRRAESEWVVLNHGGELHFVSPGGVVSFNWAKWCATFPDATFTPMVPAPDPTVGIRDVVAFAIARAEDEPCTSGHYAMADRVVNELRGRGWIVAADQAEAADRG